MRNGVVSSEAMRRLRRQTGIDKSYHSLLGVSVDSFSQLTTLSASGPFPTWLSICASQSLPSNAIIIFLFVFLPPSSKRINISCRWELDSVLFTDLQFRWVQFNADGSHFLSFPDDGEEACLLYAKHEVSRQILVIPESDLRGNWLAASFRYRPENFVVLL